MVQRPTPTRACDSVSVSQACRFPRNEFSQSALNEIGSFLTIFRVKRHVNGFLAKIDMRVAVPSEAVSAALTEALDEITDDDAATVAASQQTEANTSDCVIKRLMTELTGHQFEKFMALLLECIG